MKKYSQLFTPIKIGSVEIKNRYAMAPMGPIGLSVNPQAAREKVRAYNPFFKKKKVLIAGGGVSGCEAARVLALRGHEPVLYEKSDRLGGNLIPGGVPDFKEDDGALVSWFEHQLETLKVPLVLNTAITKEFILSNNFDTVIIATGPIPKKLNLGNNEKVFTAEEVLLKKADPGKNVVVVGSGLISCETALWLSQEGKTVTIVEVMDELLAVNGPLCHANSDMLKELIPLSLPLDTVPTDPFTRISGSMFQAFIFWGMQGGWPISCMLYGMHLKLPTGYDLFDLAIKSVVYIASRAFKEIVLTKKNPHDN